MYQTIAWQNRQCDSTTSRDWWRGLAVTYPKPVVLTEDIWTVQELRIAIGRLQLEKSPDHCGVSAELLQHVPEEFLTALLRICHSVLEDGEVPDCWRTTCFHMLPKKLRPMHATDVRPIANLRLLYKVFAYHIGFLVVSSIHLPLISPKTNMDSAQNTGLKSTCLQPICSLTKRQRTEYRFGW